MGGVFGCVSSDIEVILSTGPEYEDRLIDRIQGHSPFISPMSCRREGFAVLFEMAETLIESTKDPKWEVGERLERVGLRQEVGQ